MARFARMKVVSFKAPQELVAMLPEISRLHGYKSIGDVIRRLLNQEIARLQPENAQAIPQVKGKKRART